MLTLKTTDGDLYDEKTGKFIRVKGTTLQMEHSLLSLSKWESIHKKPFLSPKEKLTNEELIDYIRCMTITPNVDPNVYLTMNIDDIKAVSDYINDSHTATWFAEDKNKRPSREIVTSELIYYWMVSFNIPFTCEKWHLQRLITLIRICGIKNQPPKKMGRKDAMHQQASLNAMRRARMGTKG